MFYASNIGELVLIGTGGFIGASLRYTVASRVPKIQNIPTGTLTVNFLGSIVLALLTFSSEPESMVYMEI
jgi:CrcB protein